MSSPSSPRSNLDPENPPHTAEQNADRLPDNPYTTTENDLKRQLKKGNHGRYLTQLYAGFTASIGAVSFGAVLGWSSPILYKTDLALLKVPSSTDDLTWLASIAAIGAVIGIVPWAYFNQRFGPKKTMLCQAPLNIISWVTIAKVQDQSGDLAGRFFSGFLSISYMVSGECLLIDTVHQKNLQHLLVMYHSSVVLGVLVTWTMGQLLTDTTATWICASFCGIHACLLMILPESPVYLFKNSTLKAEKALAWYRGKKQIYTEMRDIKQYSDMRKIDPQATEAMLYSKVVIKGILIVLGIKFFGISSGYYIFLFYNVDMVHEMVDIVDNVHDTMFYGLLMYVCSCISMSVHYRSNMSIRKPLLLSSALVTLILSVFSIYLALMHLEIVEMSELAKRIVPVLCVCLLVPAYETGLSCYAEIALIYYVPQEVYPRARNILKMWHWFLVFIFVKCVIIVRDWLTFSFSCIAILAGLSLIGVLFMQFVVVETKGKSLVQVQRDIGGNPIGTRGRLTHHARLLTVT